MKRDPKILLDDVIGAIVEIREYTVGMDLPAYRESRVRRRAVERCSTIIGEALIQLRKHYPDLASRLGNPREIVDFRNLLTHGYHKVDDREVWDIILNDLPVLHETASKLRKGLEPEDEPESTPPSFGPGM